MQLIRTEHIIFLHMVVNAVLYSFTRNFVLNFKHSFTKSVRFIKSSIEIRFYFILLRVKKNVAGFEKLPGQMKQWVLVAFTSPKQ